MEEKLIFGAKNRSTVKPLLNGASEGQLSHIKTRINAKAPTFLSSVNPVFEEAAQVAFMLNELCNNFQKGENRKTFFANSNLEAIHGAIKIGRQAANELYKKENGKVIFYELKTYYQTIFDPLKKGVDKALIPGIQFCSEIEEINNHLEREAISILALVADQSLLSNSDLKKLIAQASAKKIIKILDTRCLTCSEIRIDYLEFLNQFDIIVWGEALANFKFPFGAFSSKDTIYAPWNNLKKCLMHTSTYGGNGMVLSYVRDRLLENFSGFNREPYRSKLTKIKKSKRIKYKTASLYINQYKNILFRSTVPMNFKKVSGSYMISKKSKSKEEKYLDCVGGSGCNLRGHNRADIVTDVLDKHNINSNYFSMLESYLSQQTGLNKAFMGNSGASAVEISMVMALLANKEKRKILVFTGNYAGKTLVALNGTAHDNSYFQPLYGDVEIINPFLPSARYDLKKVLETNEVGLVWLENIQGGGLLRLPPDLISLLTKYKKQYKFLIGIDEILHGVYRTGNFLSFDRDVIQPDIITFAKGLSNMTFPVSIALFSQSVVEQARKTNYKVVEFYSTIYKNQLGAHLALDVLTKAEHENISENVKNQSAYLQKTISNSLIHSKYFKNVEIIGLHIRFDLNMKKYPFKFFSYQKASNIIASVFYKKGKIITFYGRILPPLNISASEMTELTEGIEKVMKVPAWYYIWIGIKQYVKVKYLTFTNKLIVKLNL